MSRKKLSRNAPCPCGSGKKYKHCCYSKGFEFVEDDDGTVFKSIPMTDDVKAVLEEQRRKFIEKHGREPRPTDPVFFDMPPLEQIEHQTVQAMKAAGLDPAFIYAYKKTGRIVTEQNQRFLSEADLDEWQAAIEEYEAKHRKRPSPDDPIGTVALYGPDGKTTTKIIASVVPGQGTEPILRQWVGTDLTNDKLVERELQEFFRQHGVEAMMVGEENYGCPHEEGKDYPQGEDCPFCPFWKGKQGGNTRN
jgi:hypothetical protein